MLLKEIVQKQIKNILNDPFVEILLKKSNFTKIQLETFLIDVLAENIVENPLKFEEKAKLRLIKGGISRGAFNRTLTQAKRNVIRAIYTNILLGYLGIFDSTSLDMYVEIANRIQTYICAYRSSLNQGEMGEEQKEIIRVLREELITGLSEFSKPRYIFKNM